MNLWPLAVVAALVVGIRLGRQSAARRLRGGRDPFWYMGA